MRNIDHRDQFVERDLITEHRNLDSDLYKYAGCSRDMQFIKGRILEEHSIIAKEVHTLETRFRKLSDENEILKAKAKKLADLAYGRGLSPKKKSKRLKRGVSGRRMSQSTSVRK